MNYRSIQRLCLENTFETLFEIREKIWRNWSNSRGVAISHVDVSWVETTTTNDFTYGHISQLKKKTHPKFRKSFRLWLAAGFRLAEKKLDCSIQKSPIFKVHIFDDCLKNWRAERGVRRLRHERTRWVGDQKFIVKGWRNLWMAPHLLINASQLKNFRMKIIKSFNGQPALSIHLYGKNMRVRNFYYRFIE